MLHSILYHFRDYRVEWERLRAEKQKDEAAQAEDKLKKLALNSEQGLGTAVPFITSTGKGQEIADIYLKHPANESSEDEDGEELGPGQGKISVSLFLNVQVLMQFFYYSDWKLRPDSTFLFFQRMRQR